MMVRNLAVVIGAQLLALACGAALTPSDRVDITNTAATIERCQEAGRACKADGGAGCYDACMRDAGLR